MSDAPTQSYDARYYWDYAMNSPVCFWLFVLFLTLLFYLWMDRRPPLDGRTEINSGEIYSAGYDEEHGVMIIEMKSNSYWGRGVFDCQVSKREYEEFMDSLDKDVYHWRNFAKQCTHFPHTPGKYKPTYMYSPRY